MGKRVFDIVFALIIIVLFSWFIIILWLIAIVDTRTDGIFIQERIGQFGEKFEIYKLRTIQVFTTESSNVTKVGQLLRKYKFDEFPQLYNVLKGEMSFVGPRPDVAGYYDLLEGENRKIVELKPGLTSLAALKYYNEEEHLAQQKDPLWFNDNIIFPDKVQLNLNYYYHRSFLGDIKIIVKSVALIYSK